MLFNKILSGAVVWLLSVLALQGFCENSESNFVEKFGKELWNLSKLVTNQEKTKNKYKNRNASVFSIDGKNLTDQIVDNVNGFLKRAERAVRCIQKKAEELATESNSSQFKDNFSLEYYNMKFFGQGQDELEWLKTNSTVYLDFDRNPDERFYNISVNFSHSAVHIPANLYDRYPNVAETIVWSKGLDDIFLKNLENDPFLGWQFFGATSGMMRLYPAIEWRSNGTDMYDCRTQDWFIEAATCTKDVIILMDTSGSMTGMRNTVAKLVVNTLLDTLGNNDFVNVYNFTWEAVPRIRCFDGLIQATKENIKSLKNKVMEIVPEGGQNASIPTAFQKAFEVLQEARERRGCENNTNCHQAIMFITDGIPSNISEVFEEYNRLPDGTIPVRVFTYLIGLEVQGVNEMQNIACQNRGYYVHIHNLDEVRDQVLKYIPVIARPMTLKRKERPIRWTHLFVDTTDPKVSEWLQITETKAALSRLDKHLKYLKSDYFSSSREDAMYLKNHKKNGTLRGYKTMISVSVPVFGPMQKDNETKNENLLLGVAGTDVWVDEIFKLTYPYKIGANGYAFIITNNGYLVMHPDLRPVQNGTLKDAFASVDLIDVEFSFSTDDTNEIMTQLRDLMLNFSDGEVKNVSVKFHYDNMKRVGIETRDYYFAPLTGTPYILGVAVPSVYGNNKIRIGDEVKKELLTGLTLTDYFEGDQWRLHPDWFYCGFTNQSNSDQQKQNFFNIIRTITRENWNSLQDQMKSLKQQFIFPDEQDTARVDCKQPIMNVTFDKNTFCDIDLLQLLIFDAKITKDFFKNPIKDDQKLLKTFNATVRFVATQSGLTRWNYLGENSASSQAKFTNDKLEFADMFPRTIDESWFKASLFQYHFDTNGEHSKDSESFVFSVPFNKDNKNLEETLVTATAAVFHRDGGKTAPALVLGYQLTYNSLKSRFEEMSTKYSVDCKINKICYLLDQNGYIVLDSKSDNVGKFFGEVERDTTVDLIKKKYYRKVEIMDYQAICEPDHRNECSLGSTLRSTLSFIGKLTNWLVIEILWSILQTPFSAISVLAQNKPPCNNTQPQKNETLSDEEIEEAKLNKTCLIKMCLYLRDKWEPLQRSNDSNSRLFSVRTIPHTNLLLVVIDDLQIVPQAFSLCLPHEPEVIEESPCKKYTRTRNRKRRSLANCTTYNPEEDMSICGRANLLHITFVMIPVCIIINIIIL